jgi:hypothetical protein
LTTDTQTNPAWSNVFRSFHVISPWSVGRYGNTFEVDNFRVNQIVPDLADCTSRGIDYLPVIFPGFSWTNLNNGPFNQIPRNGGNFYWRQAYNALRSGCTMVYGAMFDEVDEGTAMLMVTTWAATGICAWLIRPVKCCAAKSQSPASFRSRRPDWADWVYLQATASFEPSRSCRSTPAGELHPNLKSGLGGTTLRVCSAKWLARTKAVTMTTTSGLGEYNRPREFWKSLNDACNHTSAT